MHYRDRRRAAVKGGSPHPPYLILSGFAADRVGHAQVNARVLLRRVPPTTGFGLSILDFTRELILST